jgi:hypothetical protein
MGRAPFDHRQVSIAIEADEPPKLGQHSERVAAPRFDEAQTTCPRARARRCDRPMRLSLNNRRAVFRASLSGSCHRTRLGVHGADSW